MKFLVVYFSRGGKTRKVANAISQELQCEAIDVNNETPNVSEVDLLVIGSGNYGGAPHKTIQGFLNSLQPSSNGKAAIFATAGGPNPKCIPIIKEALKMKGYKVVSTFECLGQFSLFNRGHPTEDDLKNAQAFARELKRGQS